MTIEVKDLLPDAPQLDGLDEYWNPHKASVQTEAPVEELASLKGAPEPLREAVLHERRRRSSESALAALTIVSQNEAIERAKIDPVTGLRNRQAFEQEMPAIFERSQAGELTILYFDLNGLKRVNKLDKAHAAGDRYLKTVADAIKSALRPTDLVYRDGGDEVTGALVGDMDEEKLGELGRRVKNAVDTDISRLDLPTDLYLGVSVGGAVKRAGEDVEAFKTRADVACEADKQAFYDKILTETGQDLRR